MRRRHVRWRRVRRCRSRRLAATPLAAGRCATRAPALARAAGSVAAMPLRARLGGARSVVATAGGPRRVVAADALTSRVAGAEAVVDAARSDHLLNRRPAVDTQIAADPLTLTGRPAAAAVLRDQTRAEITARVRLRSGNPVGWRHRERAGASFHSRKVQRGQSEWGRDRSAADAGVSGNRHDTGPTVAVRVAVTVAKRIPVWAVP